LGRDGDVKEKKKIKENRNEELKEAGGKSSWKERRKKRRIAEGRMRRRRKKVHKRGEKAGISVIKRKAGKEDCGMKRFIAREGGKKDDEWKMEGGCERGRGWEQSAKKGRC
jgi:hypothetical protein